jgi:hypothetical protein
VKESPLSLHILGLEARISSDESPPALHKPVLTITYLLYIRLPLFIDTGFHSQLSEVVDDLNEFIKEHDGKYMTLVLVPNLFSF